MSSRAFRTVLHGTCLLNGQHPPGSKLARECPLARRPPAAPRPRPAPRRP